MVGVSEAESGEKRVGWRTPSQAVMEFLARVGLGALAITALLLAFFESHEVIGTAMVGAAIAFGLGAAFFDRLIEVSRQGVRLRDQKEIEEAADRAAPSASGEEKAELVDEGVAILAKERSAGQQLTPEQAVRQARLEMQENALALELPFGSWLQEHGWSVRQPERLVAAGQPDLIAERQGRLLAVEIKTGRHPLRADVVHQVLALAASVEAVIDPAERAGSVRPVLVIGRQGITAEATARAEDAGVTVYIVEGGERIELLVGGSLTD